MRKFIFLLLLCWGLSAQAATQVSFAWDAAATATSYIVYCGNTSGNYGAGVNVGNVLVYTMLLASGKNYYCAASAVNANGEGVKSAEAVFHIKPEKVIIRRGP